MRIEFDTEFASTDHIYTRANAGEVFPQVITPLVWTLLGPGIERGMMRCMAGDFAAIDPLPDGYLACGRMAGRLHLNLTVFRTVSARMPGGDPRDLDIQYFGDAVANGLPAYQRTRADRRRLAKTTLATLGTVAGFERRLHRESAEALRLQEQTSALLARCPDERTLLDHLLVLRAPHSRGMGSQVTARALASSAVSLAMKAYAKRDVAPPDALRAISDIPDLLSAKPSRALQALAAGLPDQAVLTKALSDGMTWQELQVSDVEHAEDLRARLVTFLRDYGHRGVNEFDPASRVWGNSPDLVLGLLRPLLNQRPADRLAMAPSTSQLGPVGRRLLANARTSIARGERTKDNIIRITHQMRLTLDALAERLNDRLGLVRQDLLAMSLEELRAVVEGSSVPAAAIERRQRELDAARAVEPAEWSQGSLVLRERHTSTGVQQLAGLPGAGGIARGPVRILRDVDDDFDDGDVLVVSMTDTAWTPLFLAAAGVITDSGGPLSHATIVAREIGIPSVVNTKTATTELSDGDVVEVDGDQGVVRVLERALPRAGKDG
ncbi:MAG: PEP-utilizing enzyme [Mycobacteriales bacterium]